MQETIFSLPEVLNSNGAVKLFKYIITFSLNEEKPESVNRKAQHIPGKINMK